VGGRATGERDRFGTAKIATRGDGREGEWGVKEVKELRKSQSRRVTESKNPPHPIPLPRWGEGGIEEWKSQKAKRVTESQGRTVEGPKSERAKKAKE
jgi:hypothetical protein